jgi:hypothetical protein
LVTLAALAGCGTGDRKMSQAARTALQPLVARARERAAAHDAAGAERVLAALRRKVDHFERTNDIDETDADRIKHAASEVEHRLTLITTTTTTTTTTTVPPPPPKKPDDHHGPGHKPDHGHDKGGKGKHDD